MQGKYPVLANRALTVVLDSLTKSTLIDFVVDVANREVGEHASDDEKLAAIEKMLHPIDVARSQKPSRLLARMERIRASDKAYRQSHRSN